MTNFDKLFDGSDAHLLPSVTRTITYDPTQYKLVPVIPRIEIHIAANIGSAAYEAMLAAVPDDLPGVVAHAIKKS